MSDDFSRNEKQSYLRDNIIEKGYKPEKFVEYMQALREGGDNIDVWTLEELKDIVDRFVEKTPLEAEKPEAEPEEEETTAKPEPKAASRPSVMTSPGASAVVSPQVKLQVMQNVFEEIQTRPLEPNDCTNKRLSIRITNTMIDKGGIFSSASVEYVIETMPVKWTVVRKYDDALWLRDQLQRFFPAEMLPSLNRKGAKSKTTTKGINKRVLWLQKFFDELQRDKTVRSTDFFVVFFSLTDRSLFEKKKKELSKQPVPRSPPEIKHLGGKTCVGITPEKVDAGKNIQAFSTVCQGLYDKLMKANEDTVKIMRVLAEAFTREAEIYKELTLAYGSIDSVETSDTFNTLRIMMEGQSELIYNQSVLMMDRLGMYYQYYRDEAAAIKEASAVVTAKGQEYNKKENRLYLKKEKLYLEGNPKQWDIKPEELKKFTPKQIAEDKGLAMRVMLPKETRDLEETCLNYGYYLNKLLEETRRMTLKNYRKMRKHMKMVADEEAELLKKSSERWNATSQHFNDKISRKPLAYREGLLKKIVSDLSAPPSINFE